MRHGIAEDTAPSGDDADRQLTPEGKRKVVEVARGLKTTDVHPEIILSSPLPRAMETATLTAEVLDEALEVERFPLLAPGYDAETTLNALGAYRGADGLMLVGHQPHLGEIASFLLTGSTIQAPFAFKKGGVAAFAVDTLPPKVRADLLWFMTPKQLRSLAWASAK
jgi:phosphohistidine phosphatase